ncbi:MAG: hypothetical protein ACI8S6_003106, partial [Myxococcota bacterium]
MMSSVVVLLAASLSLAQDDPTCYAEVEQDLNCNSIDVRDESAVDLTDPECAENTDTDGVTFPNADYYFDYTSYGCGLPVYDLDADGDGFSYGGLSVGSVSLFLTCDNCPNDYNPDQADFDCDTVGNPCDNCPDIKNPNQSDLDEDGLGDSCDGCPLAFDPAQTDIDGDGIGDACDNCTELSNPLQDDLDKDAVGN